MKCNVSKDFCIKCKKYIGDQLDMRGGGCISCNKLGLYQVDACYRASKFKIFRVNVALFFMWLFRPRGFKKLNKMQIVSIIMIATILLFYIGIFLSIVYKLLLATGG